MRFFSSSIVSSVSSEGLHLDSRFFFAECQILIIALSEVDSQTSPPLTLATRRGS